MGFSVPPEVPLAISTKLPLMWWSLGSSSTRATPCPCTSSPRASGWTSKISGFSKAVFNSRLDQIAGNRHYFHQQDSLPPTTARCPSTGPRRTSQRCGIRRSGTKALQTAILWTNLCLAFLSLLLTEPLTKTAELIAKIKEMMRSFDRDTMVMACKMVGLRIKDVVAAERSFIKYVHSRYILLQSFFTSIKSVNF